MFELHFETKLADTKQEVETPYTIAFLEDNSLNTTMHNSVETY